MPTKILFSRDVPSSARESEPPICHVLSETDRAYPVVVTFGPRSRVLLTEHEAVQFARALLDAALAVRPDLKRKSQ